MLSTTLAFTGLDVLALYLVAFVMNHLIIPKYLYTRKLVFLLFSCFLLIFAYAYGLKLVQLQWYRTMSQLPAEAIAVFNTFTYQAFNTWLIAFTGMTCVLFYRLLKDHYVSAKRMEELHREKAETELNFLKAQINPHFLFNSINSIYGSIDRNNTGARNMIMKFSDMLRYQLYECNGERVNIQKETQYLQNFVDLQILRKDNVQVRMTMDIPSNHLEIPPLILIHFVENAFKHVSNHELAPNEISISMTQRKKVLIFTCSNTRENPISGEMHGNGGIGITNVKRRLELMFPGKYQLEIKKSEDKFDVSLHLELS